VVAAILHANNLRDIDTDRVNNKRTLATILGVMVLASNTTSLWAARLSVSGCWWRLAVSCAYADNVGDAPVGMEADGDCRL
jgi:1,4-dihydroxy-2-naphthoate octaprenyltransferase